MLQGPIAGFAHLEPRRHIPYITDLDGPETATLGLVLSRAARALRHAADAELIHVYPFGDHTPHLHFTLAPHCQGMRYVAAQDCWNPTSLRSVSLFIKRWPKQRE